MRRLTIDSNDFKFPFNDDIKYNPRILYHGTSSSFRKSIETNGLDITKKTWSYEEIEYIEQLSLKLGRLEAEYYNIRDFSLNTNEENKPLSFTGNYYSARQYCRQSGGETIFNCLKVIDNILDSINGCIDYAIQNSMEIQNIKIKSHYGEKDKSELIAIEENKIIDAFREVNLDYLQNIKSKYQKINSATSVVYVVKLTEDQFQKYLPKSYGAGVLVPPEYLKEIWIMENISFDQFLYEIEYPEGVEKLRGNIEGNHLLSYMK